MRTIYDRNSDQKKQKILNQLQSMDFEDMFSNFSCLPTVNFAVGDSEVSDKLWGDRPTRRTLFQEFNSAAVREFDTSPTFKKRKASKSKNKFSNGPTQSNFSPSKKQRRKKRGITLNNSSKFRLSVKQTHKGKDYRIRNTMYSSKNNINLNKGINYKSVQAHNLKSLKELVKPPRNSSKNHLRHSSKGNLIHNRHAQNRQVYRSMNYKNMFSLQTEQNENSSQLNQIPEKVTLSQNQTIKLFKIKNKGTKAVAKKDFRAERRNSKNARLFRKSMQGSFGGSRVSRKSKSRI
jgi:hypothetical protein